MSLLETLPASIADQRRAESASDPVIAVAVDLTLEGRFGEEWLVVSDTDISVYSFSDNVAKLRFRGSPEKITNACVDSLIGGAALMATFDNTIVELVRYSNACQAKMGRAHRYLTDSLKYRDAISAGKDPGAKPHVEPDTSDRKRCPACHLLLPEGTRVCPACLDKGKVILRLIGYLKPYWKQTMLIWILMFLGLIAGLIPPYLTRPLMDKVLVPTGTIMPTEAERIALLGWLVLGLLVSQLAGQIIGIFRERLLVRVGTSLSHDLRVQLY